MKIFPRSIKSIVAAIVVGVLASVLLLASCQSRLIYFPRPYGSDDVSKWDAQPGTEIVKYETSSGQQQAHLLSLQKNPKHLWILCAGNGTLALEWSDWLRKHGSPDDAWLMVDYPGYGACSGTPNPISIRKSLRAAIPAAAAMLSWKLEPSDDRLRFFGHSLGSAVSLMAASEFKIQRGVLLTPFTSTMDMSRAITRMPLGFLIWHRFDNRARLAEMEKRGNGAVFVIHGSSDEAIPVSMSRELSAEFPKLVRLTEVPGGRHNNLGEIAPEILEQAIKEARRSE